MMSIDINKFEKSVDVYEKFKSDPYNRELEILVEQHIQGKIDNTELTAKKKVLDEKYKHREK